MSVIEKNYALKIDSFMSELDKITDNEYFHQNIDMLTCCLIDSVHSIVDSYERIKDKISLTDKEFIRAFCYVNNQIKHDRKLAEFSMNFYSAQLPTRLPCILGKTSCSIEWADFEDHGDSRAEGKRTHYDTYLKNNDVGDTLKKAKAILDNIVP